MKYKLLLDFDRTLFDTHNFWIDLGALLSERYNLPSNWLKDKYPKYVLSRHDQQMVSFELLLNQSGIPGEELASSITKMIKKKKSNYLFSDAVEILEELDNFAHDYEVEILTFGDKQFQNLKAGPVELIKQIPIKIISEPKAMYIKREFSGYRGALIDDKPDQQLPLGWIEINLLRSSRPRAVIYEKTNNIYVVSNLLQASQLLFEYKR